jgi:hypothetical protein
MAGQAEGTEKQKTKSLSRKHESTKTRKTENGDVKLQKLWFLSYLLIAS